MRKRLLLAALIFGSLLCVAFARRTAAPTRWEYFVTCARVDFQKVGEDGWELAAATQEGNATCLYFKRPR